MLFIIPVAPGPRRQPDLSHCVFAAVSPLFVLPVYPSLLAVVEFDDTGSTRIGKHLFNQHFLIPGAWIIFFAVVLGYVFVGGIL